MKRNLILLLFLLAISCADSAKNPTGLNPENMTEEELYMYYGLEAPSDVYKFIYEQINKENSFSEIFEEKTVSPFIRVLLNIDSTRITEVHTRFSDYSSKLDSLIVSSLMNRDVNFSFMEKGDKLYDFRIDMAKLCKGNDFSPTPLKDSTLSTMPLLNKTIEETNEIVNDPEKVKELRKELSY